MSKWGQTNRQTDEHMKRLVERERLAVRSLKIGQFTVSRPRIYAQTPPIQNLGETEAHILYFGTFTGYKSIGASIGIVRH